VPYLLVSHKSTPPVLHHHALTNDSEQDTRNNNLKKYVNSDASTLKSVFTTFVLIEAILCSVSSPLMFLVEYFFLAKVDIVLSSLFPNNHLDFQVN